MLLLEIINDSMCHVANTNHSCCYHSKANNLERPEVFDFFYITA